MNNADYSTAQRDAIKAAVTKTRAVLAEYGQRGIEASDFLQFFARYNGIQIPGRTIHMEEAEAIARAAMSALRKSHKFDYSLSETLRDAVRREINRAYSEVYWLSAASHPDAVGLRLVITDTIENRECCQQFIKGIDYGIGIGIFPKDEVAVLPPCCDRAYFEVVFNDEIEQG